jgi:H+/Cl- antiporter ClcA
MASGWRRSRTLWTRRVWQPRLVFWTGALAIGLISVLFARLADETQLLFREITTGAGWRAAIPVILTPAGFVAATYLAGLFPGSRGVVSRRQSLPAICATLKSAVPCSLCGWLSERFC